MSDYTVQATWNTKDALATGESLKAVSATELGTEFDAIQVAVATKYDVNDIASEAAAAAETVNNVLITPARLGFWADNEAGVVGDLQDLTAAGFSAADALIGWDDSASAAIGFTLGEGLVTSGTAVELDLSEISTVAIAATDTLVFYDVSGSANGKTTVTLLEAGLQIANMADYDANDNVDHTTVSIDTTAPLSGGGDISATRTLTFDLSGQTEMGGAELVAGDTFLVDDGDGGTNKKIKWESLGPTITESSTTTLALTDGNTMFVNTGAVEDTMTVPTNAAVAFPIGTQIGFCTQSTAAIVVAAAVGVTINSLLSNLQVKASGGGAYLVKTGTDVWSLIGDLEA